MNIFFRSGGSRGVRVAEGERVRGGVGRERRPGVSVDRQDPDAAGVERGAADALPEDVGRGAEENWPQSARTWRELGGRVSGKNFSFRLI